MNSPEAVTLSGLFSFFSTCLPQVSAEIINFVEIGDIEARFPLLGYSFMSESVN